MQYELKNVTDIKSYREGDNIISTGVAISGIVGDTYGFNRWDNIQVSNPGTMTLDEAEATLQVAGATLVATKYPNT